MSIGNTFRGDTLADCAVTQNGGLEHLRTALGTLADDFSRLDSTIEGLAQTLSLALPSKAEDGSKTMPPPSRSVIEELCNTVLLLQRRSEEQRMQIEHIVESIQ